MGDSDHVYLTGSAIVAVDRNRESRWAAGGGSWPGDRRGLGRGLVGPAYENGQASLLELDAEGMVLARTVLLDGGGELEVSGNDVWFVGNADQGEGIVHMRLAAS